MKGEQYREISEYFKSEKKRSNIITALHDILPLIMLLFYPIQLIYLLVTLGFSNIIFLKFTFVPLAVLVFVTLLRYIVNAKRPYELYDYEPVVNKKTKGKSFPSRHTACAFIIAMAFLYIQLELGIIMLVLAVLIGLTRILSGVHFIRDVIGGALIGIIPGIICFFLI